MKTCFRTGPLNRFVLKMFPSLMLTAMLSVAPIHSAFAQIAPSLGTAESFAVLGASTVTNTGPTIVTGDLGVAPGSAITGFPPGLVIGAIHAADAVALQAQTDTTAAYNDLAGQACDTTFGVPTDIGGLTLVPGVYCFSSSVQLTGALTLNAQGNPDAVWIFKVASTLITASNASVLMINGGQNCNVFWQVGSSATIGTGTDFIGNILALTSITLTTNADLSGRALARNGAVTMDSNNVAISSCAIPPNEPIPPTVGKTFTPATINEGDSSTLIITLSNPDDTVATLTGPFTDTLPAGVLIDGTATTTCGGVVSTGASSVTLTGGSIPANGSCTITVDVTAAAGGSYINSIAAGDLDTTNGSNGSPAVATLTVVSPTAETPTVSKAFSPASINEDGISAIIITLSNPSDTVATLTSLFTDNLPSGVFTSGAGITTCGGVVSTTASSVTLTGGAIPANGSCTITVNVTAPTGGNYVNTIFAGDLDTSNGSNTAPTVATLTVIPVVVPPTTPTISKKFSPSKINIGKYGIKNSTLTITLNNPNNTVANLTAPFTDTLPSGLITVGVGSTTCGGVVSTTATSVTLTGGSIPANGSCTVSVLVTGQHIGVFVNSIPAGELQTNLGNDQSGASSTLKVICTGKTCDK